MLKSAFFVNIMHHEKWIPYSQYVSSTKSKSIQNEIPVLFSFYFYYTHSISLSH